MTVPSVMIVVGLLVFVGMRLLMRFGSRRALLEVRSLTGENLAIVLSGMELVQFTGALSKIGGAVGAPTALLVPVALGAVVLAGFASVVPAVVVVISMLGIGAGFLEALVTDGPERAGVLVMLTLVALSVMMGARQILPCR